MIAIKKGFGKWNVLRSIVKESYFDFVKEFWHTVIPEKPVWNWHLEYLANEIQDTMEPLFAGEPREYDLISNQPPGTSKSTLFSILLVPWCWTRMPTLRSLNASHTDDLVMDLSAKCRQVIESEKYRNCFPEIQFRSDQNTKGYFANTYGGMRKSCTVGGKNPVGFHCHLFVIDDPIDPQKAISDKEIKQANDFMIQTVPNRRIDKDLSVTMLVMQRLHQNDPTGNWLDREQDKSKIRHLCFPAEKTDNLSPKYCRKYYEDDLFDPVRLSAKTLKEYKALGDYTYAGQYLQNPIPLGGGMFKTDRLHFSDSYPKIRDLGLRNCVRYWDKAGTSDDGTFTVGALMALEQTDKNDPDSIRFWIVHIERGQWEAFQREEIIKATAKQDGARYVQIRHEQEPGSGGKESAQATTRRLAGFHVQEDKVTGDKVTRAFPFAYQVNAGNVWVVKAEWNRNLIDEMKFFPNSTYKDQVDALSGAFAALTKPRLKLGAL